MRLSLSAIMTIIMIVFSYYAIAAEEPCNGLLTSTSSEARIEKHLKILDVQNQFFERMEKFAPHSNSGFSAEWITKLQFVGMDYFKAEQQSFENVANLLGYIQHRHEVLSKIAEELDHLSFGGLVRFWNRQPSHFRDVLLDFVEREISVLEQGPASFIDIRRERHSNLMRLLRNLDLMTYYVQGSSSAVVNDYIELRAIWIDYIKSELAIDREK